MAMDRLYLVSAIICICIIGFLRVNHYCHHLLDVKTFAIDFLDKLRTYLSSNGSDGGTYSWLTLKSNKMQNQLGSAGIMAAYKPPFANFQYTNYPIILNMLPELRNALSDSYVLSRLADQYAATIQEVIIRHIGSIEEIEEFNRKKLKNPIIWFREGVQLLISSPLYAAFWLGVIKEPVIDRLTGNIIFKFISTFVTLVGFVGSVITIVIGWDQFLSMTTKFVGSRIYLPFKL